MHAHPDMVVHKVFKGDASSLHAWHINGSCMFHPDRRPLHYIQQMTALEGQSEPLQLPGIGDVEHE